MVILPQENNMETLTRKVVSLVTRHLDGGDSQFVALCDDGTMWIFRGTLAGTGYRRYFH